MFNKFTAPLAVLGIAAALITVMVVFRPTSPPRAQEPEPVTLIEVADVSIGDYAVQLPSQGIVQSQIRSTLAAEVAGSIKEVAPQFRRGGAFKRGDWLATIDDRDYVAAVKLAEAQLQQADVGVMEENARVAQARLDWERLGNGEAANDLVLRKPQLAAATSNRLAMAAQLSKAKLNLERTRIVAPYTGRVIKQMADIGDHVSPGKLLAETIGNEILEVSLPISSQWRDLIDWEQRVPVTLSITVNHLTHSWYGQVVRTSADIDTGSRQFSVIAEVQSENTDQNSPQLLVGDYVEAEVMGRTLAKVAVIPRHALVDGDHVWRLEQNRLYKRPVNVVWKDQEVAVIDSGLVHGDQVNITPLGYMISGSLVQITNGEQSKAGVLGSGATARQAGTAATPGNNGTDAKPGSDANLDTGARG